MFCTERMSLNISVQFDRQRAGLPTCVLRRRHGLNHVGAVAVEGGGDHQDQHRVAQVVKIGVQIGPL